MTQAWLSRAFGLPPAELVPLAGGRINRVDRCGDWVVKQYDLSAVPRERAERALRLQEYLSAAGLPVPAPLRTRDGALWAHLPPEDGDGLVAVLPYVQGSRRSRGSFTPAEAAGLGALAGRLHAALRSFSDPVTPPAPPTPAVIVARWAELKGCAMAQPAHDAFDAQVIEMADFVAEAVPRAPVVDWSLQAPQWCHGDLHQDNLLWNDRGEVAALLDFDNAAPGWPGCEAMGLWNLALCADPGRPARSPAGHSFLAAYREYGPAWEQMASAYWLWLLSNTWPAGLRYRQPDQFRPEFAEALAMRLGTARWLAAQEWRRLDLSATDFHRDQPWIE